MMFMVSLTANAESAHTGLLVPAISRQFATPIELGSGWPSKSAT
jgi:hypothetical protein